MSYTALREDSICSETGTVVRVNLPWIRSLPLSNLRDIRMAVDGVDASISHVETASERVDVDALDHSEAWWFIHDHIGLALEDPLPSGTHTISVSFRLLVPYLQMGPDTPLVIDVHESRRLSSAAPVPTPAAARIRARTSVEDELDVTRTGLSVLPAGWTPAASAFNWTVSAMRGEQTADDIVFGIASFGIADHVEIEAGQTWRSFPAPVADEVDATREGIEARRGHVSIVGASLDDWQPDGSRRTEDERLAFLLPQLRAAQRVGAHGIRLPIAQAGSALVDRLLPSLDEMRLVLYQEIQGQQDPQRGPVADALQRISDLDDPHLRVLIDTSMLMPALPPSYLEVLARGGINGELLDRLEHEWLDPATHETVVTYLRSGSVPPAVHASYMNMLIRFGRSSISSLAPLLPLTGAFHLKFWDLDDADGRVSAPLRDLGGVLDRVGFTGTLCSEWGGHEWLTDADPERMTRAHLQLATAALADGAGNRSVRPT